MSRSQRTDEETKKQQKKRWEKAQRPRPQPTTPFILNLDPRLVISITLKDGRKRIADIELYDHVKFNTVRAEETRPCEDNFVTNLV